MSLSGDAGWAALYYTLTPSFLAGKKADAAPETSDEKESAELSNPAKLATSEAATVVEHEAVTTLQETSGCLSAPDVDTVFETVNVEPAAVMQSNGRATAMAAS